jgi:TPR repeat protein
MRDHKKELLSAAEGGNADAQFNLGMLLENRADDNGYAIEGGKAAIMHAEAVRWLLSAAEQDLPRAQLQLAEAYAAGEAPEDYLKAAGWFLVAMTRLSGVHRHRARTGYELVCSRLTPAQITKGTQFARIWKPKTVQETGRV